MPPPRNSVRHFLSFLDIPCLINCLTLYICHFHCAEIVGGGVAGRNPAAGGTVVADAGVTHAMTWPSVNEFWEGMKRAGPWYSRRLQQGDSVMDAARAAFGAPGGGFEDGGAPVRHAPRARLLVVRRQAGAGAPMAAL